MLIQFLDLYIKDSRAESSSTVNHHKTVKWVITMYFS